MLIAVDVDGTLYDGIEVAPEAVASLRRARADGHRIVIVTGRRWEELDCVIPMILELADRAVCEEGTVLVNVATTDMTLLAEVVELELVAELVAVGVPALDIGHVVIGAPTTALQLVTEARDRVGSRRRIVTNKGSIALTPQGCDKGTGLLAALADLGLDINPSLAIGDASNDLAMFDVATIAVGVANADAAVRASGVPITVASFGRGVAEALDRFLPPTLAE